MINFNKTGSLYEYVYRLEQDRPMDSVYYTFCPEGTNLLPHTCD